jgi:hypothetical protein
VCTPWTHRQARDQFFPREIGGCKESSCPVRDILDGGHDPLAVSRVRLHLASHASYELLCRSRHFGVGKQESNRLESARGVFSKSVGSGPKLRLRYSPSQSGHSPRLPIHRSRKAQGSSFDGNGIVDPTWIAVNNLLSQECPTVDQVRL